MEDKTPGQAQPVFLEDAGLYVVPRPKVTIGNLATLENRLLRRPDKVYRIEVIILVNIWLLATLILGSRLVW